MLVTIVGVLLSIVLFIIGVIRGLLKKGWKMVVYAVLLFITTVVVYSVAQNYYLRNAHPSVIQNLQNSVIK